MARRLSFKKVFVEPILEGRKTSTLRAWTYVSEGEQVNFTCRWGDPPFAVATVARVSEVGLDDLDDDLARAEGFADQAELRAVLERLYPDASQFVRIDFTL